MTGKKTTKYRVDFVGFAPEVTDRQLSQKHLADDLHVKADRDLRWFRGAPEYLENPDATLLDYFEQHIDEFKVTELTGDAAAEAPAE